MITNSHKSIIDGYVKGVLDGSIVTGVLQRQAVARYVWDLETAAERGFWFDEATADKRLKFFPICRHSLGKFAGQPFELSPFQMFIIWNLYGWRRHSDNTRRFRKALVEVARKNGKSTMAAALGLLMLLDPEENGPQVYIAATKEAQAKIIHDEAKRMRAQSPLIAKKTKQFHNSLTYPAKDGVFKPLGSDSHTNDGWNPSGILIDELHAWRENSHRGLWERLDTGGASREQPLTVMVTTAGDDASIIWKEERDFASRVVSAHEEGDVVADNMFVFVACIDADDDPLDESAWKKSNPNYGVSVKPEYLREQAETAKANPAKFNSFRRFHCNILTASSERAIDPRAWMKSASIWEPKDGCKAFGGIDLGRSDDWCSIALLFDTGDGYHFKTWQWCAQQRAKQLDTAEVRGWIHEGLLFEHPGDQVDFSAVREMVEELDGRYKVEAWSFDPHFAKETAQLLTEAGVQLTEMKQTAVSYNEPVREFLRRLAKGRITHEQSPCLSWQARNLTIYRNRQDQWMPDKGGEKWQKIDGMVATVMAFREALFGERDPVPTYYNDHDLEVI